MTSQAPSPNFVQITITVTSPVADAPTVFTSARPRHPGPRTRRQYFTMPACESVKAVKTPIT